MRRGSSLIAVDGGGERESEREGEGGERDERVYMRKWRRSGSLRKAVVGS